MRHLAVKLDLTVTLGDDLSVTQTDLTSDLTIEPSSTPSIGAAAYVPAQSHCFKQRT